MALGVGVGCEIAHAGRRYELGLYALGKIGVEGAEGTVSITTKAAVA